MTSTTDTAAPALAPGPHHATPERLMARLAELGIPTRTVEHPPLYTVEESRRLRGDLPGGHCKNLFLKDRKDQLWLVVTLEDRAIDMKGLSDRIGSARLSFGRPELLVEVLGITPGAVTPFALINDPGQRVSVVLDREMMGFDPLNYHPLTNRATTAIAPADLLRFIAACGHRPAIVDLA
ncbi:prolyl-tRNA synthetase associated domain-containing protein [Stella sp.]|uniref:prolyl-tRNA synthetase associated domain-containing protein n=1 Tax=Stella sp. TaxID=2912054 RepID=UPI0035AD98A7